MRPALDRHTGARCGVFNGQPEVVDPHDGAYDTQTQSRSRNMPRLLSAVEPLHDGSAFGTGNAGPVVDHDRLRTAGGLPQFDSDCPAIAREFHRIIVWVVWYHRLIGETEGPTLITDTACTATSCRFPSWHIDNYYDAGRYLHHSPTARHRAHRNGNEAAPFVMPGPRPASNNQKNVRMPTAAT
jgi:hypothetical protein